MVSLLVHSINLQRYISVKIININARIILNLNLTKKSSRPGYDKIVTVYASEKNSSAPREDRDGIRHALNKSQQQYTAIDSITNSDNDFNHDVKIKDLLLSSSDIISEGVASLIDNIN